MWGIDNRTLILTVDQLKVGETYSNRPDSRSNTIFVCILSTPDLVILRGIYGELKGKKIEYPLVQKSEVGGLILSPIRYCVSYYRAFPI